MPIRDVELFHDIYKDISNELGTEVAIAIHNMFKGQQITFPTRLYNSKRVKEVIYMEFDGKNIRELARKYGYSEKTMRRMLKEDAEE